MKKFKSLKHKAGFAFFVLIVITFIMSCEADYMSGSVENFNLTDKVGKPTGIKIDNITTSSFTISWNKISGADSYRLYIATDNLFNEMLNGYPEIGLTGTSFTINKQVLPNTKYYIKLIAENKLNEKSYFSDVTNIQTLNGDASMYLVSNPFPRSIGIPDSKSDKYDADNRWLSFNFQYYLGFGESINNLTGDNDIIAVNTFNKLFVISKSNGDFLWQSTISGITGTPFINPTTVIVGSNDGNVYAYEKIGGAILWEYDTQSVILSSPTASETAVFVGNNGGKLVSLDINSGEKIWEYSTSGSAIKSSPSLKDGKLVFAAENGYVYCLNELTGALIWKYKPSAVLSKLNSPTVDANTIYITDEQGVLYALNTSNGSLKWKYVNNAMIKSSPGIVNDKLVFYDENNFLKVVNTTGNFVWELNLENHPINEITVSKFGKIYVPGIGADANEVWSVDIESKKVIVWNQDKYGRYQINGPVIIQAGDGDIAYPTVSGNRQ
jgi:outer membrane protein assembly factor BamB